MTDVERVLKEMTFAFFGAGQHKTTPAKLLASRQAVLLDVRSNEEDALATFPLRGLIEYIHIPVTEVPERLDEIPKDRTVGVFCSSGPRACMVYLYLRAKGYADVRIVEGGYEALMDELKPGKAWARMQTRQSDCGPTPVRKQPTAPGTQ